jgi:hypothetical protein
MRTASRFAGLVALAPVAFFAVACAAPVESDPTAATSEGIVVPIFLPTCDTESPLSGNVGASFNEEIGSCAWQNEVSSPSATYGGTWCSDTYVVEVDKLVKGVSFNIVAGPENDPGTATTCNDLHTATTVWAHTAAGWQTLGSNASQGKWETGGLFSFCSSVTGTHSGTFTVKGTEGFDMIRIGTSAWEQTTVNGQTVKTYVKVAAGISGGAAC